MAALQSDFDLEVTANDSNSAGIERSFSELDAIENGCEESESYQIQGSSSNQSKNVDDYTVDGKNSHLTNSTEKSLNSGTTGNECEESESHQIQEAFGSQIENINSSTIDEENSKSPKFCGNSLNLDESMINKDTILAMDVENESHSPQKSKSSRELIREELSLPYFRLPKPDYEEFSREVANVLNPPSEPQKKSWKLEEILKQKLEERHQSSAHFKEQDAFSDDLEIIFSSEDKSTNRIKKLSPRKYDSKLTVNTHLSENNSCLINATSRKDLKKKLLDQIMQKKEATFNKRKELQLAYDEENYEELEEEENYEDSEVSDGNSEVEDTINDSEESNLANFENDNSKHSDINLVDSISHKDIQEISSQDNVQLCNLQNNFTQNDVLDSYLDSPSSSSENSKVNTANSGAFECTQDGSTENLSKLEKMNNFLESDPLICFSLPSYQPGGGFDKTKAMVQEVSDESSRESFIEGTKLSVKLPWKETTAFISPNKTLSDNLLDSTGCWGSKESEYSTSPITKSIFPLNDVDTSVDEDNELFNSQIAKDICSGIFSGSQVVPDSPNSLPDTINSKENVDNDPSPFEDENSVPHKNKLNSDDKNDDVEPVNSDDEDVCSVTEPEELEKPSTEIGHDFIDDEAELSGEGSSDEEDIEAETELENEDFDDVPEDEEVLRRQIGSLHSKQLLDDDNQFIKRIQADFLKEGDLFADSSRKKKYSWNTCDNTIANQKDIESDSESEDVTQNVDEKERKKWIQEKSSCQEDENNVIVIQNSSLRMSIVGKNSGSEGQKRIPVKRKRGSLINNESILQNVKKPKGNDKSGSTTRKHIIFVKNDNESFGLSTSSGTGRKTSNINLLDQL